MSQDNNDGGNPNTPPANDAGANSEKGGENKAGENQHEETLRDDIDSIDDINEARKQLHIAKRQRANFKSSAIDPETGKPYKDLYESVRKTNQPEPQKPADQPTGQGLSVMEVLNLRKQGFSEAEILDVTEESRSLGVSVTKLLGNKTYMSGVEAKRKEQQVAAGTPAPGRRSATVTAADADYKKLSASEKQEKFGMDSWKNRKR